MIDELAFLIKGYDGVINSRAKFKWLCYMVEVCKEKPVRLNGKKVDAEFLHANFLIRLQHLGKEDFRNEVNDLLDHLREFSSELYYFVLVATYRLPDTFLSESLESSVRKNWQCLSDVSNDYHDDLYEFFPVPRLLWDISPVLNGNIVIPDTTDEDPIQHSVIRPLDSRGILTDIYSELLSSDILRLANHEECSCIISFDPRVAKSALFDMFIGVSSDIFQEEDGVFYLANNCKLGCWSIFRTKAVFSMKVEEANRINSLYRYVFDKLNDVDSSWPPWMFLSLISIVPYPSDDFDRAIESQTEILTVYEHILQLESIEIPQLVFVIRCLRDSTLDGYKYVAYDVLLRGLITVVTVSVCVFVNTGRCDLSDRVFVEAAPPSISSDRSKYGETWESNLCVDLPCSPDLSSRLCRAVVKQGVLIRLLRAANATSFEDRVDLLSLYNIANTQVVADLVEELEKVSSKVGNGLKEIDAKTLENLVEWVLRSSSMFYVCSLVITAILRDVRGMCDVIRHLMLCAGDSRSSIRESRRSHIHKLRAELKARRFDNRHVSAVDIESKSGTRRLLITPPEPLSIIITAGHARRYVGIYTFLTDLTRAVSALAEVELRETKVSVQNRRKLFAFCSSMLRVVTGTRDHVLTELEAVWKLFKDDLEKVSTIDHAINAHRKALKSMMQRTLLDMSSLTTARTLRAICESCVRFAHAMNAGDETSAFIHYRAFEERAQLLREKLNVERMNMYARMLLWRIDCTGEFLDEECSLAVDACRSLDGNLV